MQCCWNDLYVSVWGHRPMQLYLHVVVERAAAACVLALVCSAANAPLIAHIALLLSAKL